eukprot:6202814-Pleurochrysis_carterae.AAC.1
MFMPVLLHACVLVGVCARERRRWPCSSQHEARARCDGRLRTCAPRSRSCRCVLPFASDLLSCVCFQTRVGGNRPSRALR